MSLDEPNSNSVQEQMSQGYFKHDFSGVEEI